MVAQVLVYGWYGKRNAGDELMKMALEQMLRLHRLEPRFVDSISEDDLAVSSGIIFGGGSILQDLPEITPTATSMLLGSDDVPPFCPAYYVGVGGETDFHEFHQTLINRSPVVAFRELDIPDLAYWHAPDIEEVCKYMARKPEGVLVIPNVEVLPTHSDPHWMHASWEHFKNEFAQVLDRVVEEGHRLSFLAMCDANKKKDTWVAHELMGRMSRRDNYHVYQPSSNEPLWVCGLMQSYQAVITQRYHGIILSEMAGVPYVSISHHDKLRLTHPHRGPDVSYYAVQKDPLWSHVETALTSHLEPYCPARSEYDLIISQIAADIRER